jgi:hypothetical protein
MNKNSGLSVLKREASLLSGLKVPVSVDHFKFVLNKNDLNETVLNGLKRS